MELVNRFEGSVTSLFLRAVNRLSDNFSKFPEIGKYIKNFTKIDKSIATSIQNTC